MNQSIVALVLFCTALPQIASAVTLNAVDGRFGRFQREDNRIRKYGSEHPFLVAAYQPGDVLPTDKAEFQAAMAKNPAYRKNSDGTYSFFYFSFEQLLRGIQLAPAQIGGKITRLNLHAEGFPGGMSIPKDYLDATTNESCSYFVNAVISDTDEIAYTQYYWNSFSTAADATAFIKNYYFDSIVYATNPSAKPDLAPCAVKPNDWIEFLAKPEFKTLPDAFAPSVQMTFVTCHTGLGLQGKVLAETLDAALFGKVSLLKIFEPEAYAMSDWSATEGALFFEYHGDEADMLKKITQERTERRDRSISDPEPVFVHERNRSVVKQSSPRMLYLPIR